MKKIILILTLILVANLSYGQIVAWSMVPPAQPTNTAGNEVTLDATTLDLNLNMSTLRRGSGINPSSLARSFSSSSYTAGGTITDAITNNEYIEFDISAAPTYQVSLSTLDVNFRRSNQGPTTFLWTYSTDGSSFTNLGSQITYTVNGGGGTAQTQIDLSSVTDIQNVPSGTTITFRLYAWGAVSGSGTFAIGRLDGNELSIGGSVTLNPCSGSTVTWTSGGWVPASGPTINTPVVIADNYDTNTNGSFNACTLTVNAGVNLNVANSRFIVVENDVTINGELFVQSQGNFVQNNDTATFTDNSTNGVRVVKGKTFPRKFSYTYWSSPIVDETIEQVFSTVQGDRRFSFNAANFVDVQQEVGNTGVFNPGSDDIDDNGDDWQIASGTMQPGVGYAAIASQFGPVFPRTESFTFIGEFNNGTIQVPLINNSGGAYNDWNFIGNPYPGAIDADQFLSVNSALVGALYFWDQATPESDTSGGSQGQNFSVDDYATYNGTMGIGARAGSGAQPNGFVASCQGFFVEALAAGNVTFNNSMRAASNNNSQFFKNTSSKDDSSSSSNNKLWVNLTTDNGVFSQIGVGYVTGATDFSDGAFYDAKRIVSSGNAAILYSIIENDNDKYAIQGKATSSLNTDEIIKLGFNTSIDIATSYTLSIARLEGDFLSNKNIYLRDLLTNTVHNLSDSDYSFTSEVGEFNERFEIAFNASSLSNDTFGVDTNTIKIVQLDSNNVKFTTETSNFTSITIHDLFGRTLYKLDANSNDETYNLSVLKSSVYIATIELANGTALSKKFIKK
ncbi:T9SS type A sorting domain-containing protein [Hyunsoonleella ulvae]|uniref:T9SS type A sorting domain-containing protein n=1 Tax=Hyunsoonleella ulvae TaxID=2799948 RepID=UPI00193A9183|nr:T9SS type A sorting domain-containing protein [Hyunsoonleella ulvae]